MKLHTISINNWGFRDSRPYTARTSAGEFRIAAIGDSFTTNFDCPIAWPRILEDRLQQAFGKSVRVYNLGLPGAGPSNWIGLRRMIARIAPDLLLLNFYDGILERPPIRFFTDAPRRQYCVLYGGTTPTIRPVGASDGRFPYMSRSDLQRTADSLEKGNREVQQFPRLHQRAGLHGRIQNPTSLLLRNAQLTLQILTWAPASVMSLAPPKAALGGTQRRSHPQVAVLKKIASLRNVPLLDLDDALAPHGADNTYTESSHWNETGNRLVAEEFFGFLARAVSNRSATRNR